MNTKGGGKVISLQHRDISLIRMLAEDFRILNGEQIGELFPLGSIRRRNFRLKQLRDAGYLSSRELIRMGNVAKHAYYLGPRAPELFSDPTEQRLVKGIRAQVAQLAPSGLTHRMLVDSIHIRFLTAAREYANYRLVTWIDQYSAWWKDLHTYGVPIQADGYGEYLLLLHFDNLFSFSWSSTAEPREGEHSKIRSSVTCAMPNRDYTRSNSWRVLFEFWLLRQLSDGWRGSSR